MLASVYSYRVMVKSVSSCCVRGSRVLSNPVTYYYINCVWYSPTKTLHYHVLSCMSMCGYIERDPMHHVMWLHVPLPCPTWSRVSTHNNLQ